MHVGYSGRLGKRVDPDDTIQNVTYHHGSHFCQDKKGLVEHPGLVLFCKKSVRKYPDIFHSTNCVSSDN